MGKMELEISTGKSDNDEWSSVIRFSNRVLMSKNLAGNISNVFKLSFCVKYTQGLFFFEFAPISSNINF